MSKEVQVMDMVPADQNNNQVAVAQSQPDAMLAMIDRVCSDPNFDITKMEKLVDMRNAEIARVAQIDFNRAFAEMQSKLPKTIATHDNSQTNSKYAKIEDINTTVLPVLGEYGFGVSFQVLSQDKDGVKVEAILSHSGGHKESTTLSMPYDRTGAKGSVNKTDIHATGSTITYAKRYAMCMLLNISTGSDNDGNNKPQNDQQKKQPNFITAEQQAEITKLMETSGVDKVKFIRDYLKVESINHIPVVYYQKALNVLNKRIETNENS